MDWNDKRVTVTGGAGVIGRLLVDKLAASGASVTCIDRAPKPRRMPDSVRYLKMDISKMKDGVIEMYDPEVIFHLAATFERSEETPGFWGENYKDNVVLSHKVVDAAKKCEGLEKFVFASSYLIYSPTLYMFPLPQVRPRKLKETDMPYPRNLCGAAKFYTESELGFMNAVDDRFTGISARIYRVYGPGSRDVISRWVRAAMNGEELTVFHQMNMFDYIYAGDVAEGLIRMSEKVDRSDVINLGTGRPRRIRKVLDILKEHYSGLKVKDVGTKGHYEASCADTSKLMDTTGWSPRVDIEEGIGMIIDHETMEKGHA